MRDWADHVDEDAATVTVQETSSAPPIEDEVYSTMSSSKQG